MPRAMIGFLLFALILSVGSVAFAEITVSIESIAPSDGVIGEGDSATITWKITADGESGDWQFEIGGDGTWGSGETASSGDTSGSFGGTTQGTSTIKDTDLDDGDGDYTVYIIAVDGSDSENYDSTSTTISLDNPPDQVTGISVGNGNQKLFIGWEALDVDDISYYRIYYARAQGSVAGDYDGSDASEGVSPVDGGDGNTFTLNGLENEVRYYIRISAVDDGGIEGPLSEEGSSVPRESVGATDLSDEEGGCFIATAAFGSIDHPKVHTLRVFRDSVLLNHDAGRTFVKAYYRYSPPLASWLSGHPKVRSGVRLALTPLAWYAGASNSLPLLALLIPLLLFAVIAGSVSYVFVRVRRRDR